MKRVLFLLFCLFCACRLSAQTASVARVLADNQRKEFVWAIGYGYTLEEADKDAINTLVSTAQSVILSSDGEVTDSNESFRQRSQAISNIYMENLFRENLPDKDGMKRVLRYMPRDDWDKRDNLLKGKIEDYITAGDYASYVDAKMRYYSWAYVLMHTYHNNEDPITVDEKPAQAYIHEAIRQCLNDIDIRVISVEHDKENRNYPYKVYVDFSYDDMPVSYLEFQYWDGSGYISDGIKDGRGILGMRQKPDEITIIIDCLHKELARQLEPSVFMLLESETTKPSFAEAKRSVAVGVKTQKSVDTNSAKIDSQVNNQIRTIEQTYESIEAKVDNTKPFEQIMMDVVGAIQGVTTADIRGHFTDVAWDHYQKIVANGKPKVARTPEYKFTKHDTITICEALPLKLEFSKRSFVEDVVFRVNNHTKKIESVAYKLSKSTESQIMAMKWDDSARLTLISFLEDYRTAYCLMDIDYIKKVFSDDAYIIVGRVLKPSGKRFADTPYHADITPMTEYVRKSKQEYISNLRTCFSSKEFVNIRFEECKVAKGYAAKEGIYAVQVRQLYYSNNYADDGILTLAIDMRNDINPLVRVRVWHEERDVNYTAEDMIDKTVSVEGSVE